MSWIVAIHPEVETDMQEVPKAERVAIAHALQKLMVDGPRLGFPHSSAIQGADRIRELRPRQGNSPWRVFYRRVGDEFIIASVGPEAQVNPKKFTRAVTAAEHRLEEWEHTS